VRGVDGAFGLEKGAIHVEKIIPCSNLKPAIARRPVELQAPLVDISKAEIVSRGLVLKVPHELTWFCYKREVRPC